MTALAAASARPLRLPRPAVPRPVVVVATWAIATFAVSALLLLALPRLAGWHTYTVLSGSMSPALHTGDVVMDEPLSPQQLQVGDIVTYRASGARLITHRVQSLTISADTVAVVTKGDANNAVERWTVPAGGTVGRVRFHVAAIGFPLRAAGTTYGVLLLLVLPVLLIAASLLRGIWASPAAPSTTSLQDRHSKTGR
ncbi:MAG: hypothetical protein NVSMB13_04780 [Mycobacteriales bacterium]